MCCCCFSFKWSTSDKYFDKRDLDIAGVKPLSTLRHRFRYLGPVAQSIVSLTTSLRRQVAKVSICRLNYQIHCYFCWKNVRIFCSAKDSHIFQQQKKQCICNINVLNFNETLTNDVVNFEQPAPGREVICSP